MEKTEQVSLHKDFGDYWYQGKAEITSYQLEQARYGEIHKGQAVLVFVTEDFSKEKQVKLDNPQTADDDKVKVLKLNYVKKFNTGIYPYSMMQSVFTPVNRENHPSTLKLTSSTQEWCGQTFTQLNLKKTGYEVESRSYFESEGDQDLTLDKVITEDEIWNLIRLDPTQLPSGEIEIIPSLFAQRLRHQPFKIEKAIASLKNNASTNTFSLIYPNTHRSISIEFNKEFPYEIIGWEEKYKSGWGENAQTLTSKASKINSLMTDYWNKNSVSDLKYRKELGLN